MIDARSQVQVHTLHLALFGAWLLIFAGVYLRQRSRTASTTASVRDRAGAHAWASRLAGLPGAIAASSVTVGAIHLEVTGQHFRESALYGAFFLALAVAQFGYAAWIVWRPTRALYLAGALASLAVVLLWLTTRALGVPVGPAAGRTEPVGPLDVSASVAELATAILCIAALRAQRRARVEPPAIRRSSPRTRQLREWVQQRSEPRWRCVPSRPDRVSPRRAGDRRCRAR